MNALNASTSFFYVIWVEKNLFIVLR